MMSGVSHPYYSMSMAPAIAALVGADSVEFWQAHRDRASSWWLLPIAIVATGAWSWVLLARTPDFLPWLGPVVGLASIAIGLTFIVSFVGPGLSSRPATAIVAAAIVVLLAGPVSYAVASIGVDYSGGDPKAGPRETGIPNVAGGTQVAARQTRSAGGPPGPPPSKQRGELRLPGPPGDDGLRQSPRGDDGGRDGRPGSWLSDELVQYLVAERADETWIAATIGSGTASRLIFETGDAVMAMGGFAGGDPTPTAQELTGYIKSGELRFIVVGQRQEHRRWAETIQDLCTPVEPNVSGSSPGSVLYHCYTGADI